MDLIFDELLIKVTDILTEMNLDYHLTAGTCLGFYRDGGYIGNKNEDVDICVMINDMSTCDKIISEVKSSDDNFRIRKWAMDINKVSVREGTNKFRRDIIYLQDKFGCELIKNVHLIKWGKMVDLLFCFNLDNGYYLMADMWRIPSKLFEEYTYIEHEGKKYRIPKNVNEYLNSMYINWRIPSLTKRRIWTNQLGDDEYEKLLSNQLKRIT